LRENGRGREGGREGGRKGRKGLTWVGPRRRRLALSSGGGLLSDEGVKRQIQTVRREELRERKRQEGKEGGRELPAAG